MTNFFNYNPGDCVSVETFNGNKTFKLLKSYLTGKYYQTWLAQEYIEGREDDSLDESLEFPIVLVEHSRSYNTFWIATEVPN